MKSSWSGAARVAAAFAVWSTWSYAARWVALPPPVFSFYLALSGTLACAAVKAARPGGPGELKRLPRHPLLVPLLLMGLALFVNNLTFYLAIERTTVANAIFTHYLAPALVAVAAPTLLKERPLKLALPAVAVALAGMWLLLPDLGVDGDGTHLLGIGSGLVSAVAYAAMMLLTRRYVGETDVLDLILVPNGFVALAALPWALAAPLPTGPQMAVFALLGVFHIAVMTLIYMYGLRRITAQLGAVLGYIEPLGGVLIAAAFLGEPLSALAAAGGGLILLSGGMVAWEEGR